MKIRDDVEWTRFSAGDIVVSGPEHEFRSRHGKVDYVRPDGVVMVRFYAFNPGARSSKKLLAESRPVHESQLRCLCRSNDFLMPEESVVTYPNSPARGSSVPRISVPMKVTSRATHVGWGDIDLVQANDPERRVYRIDRSRIYRPIRHQSPIRVGDDVLVVSGNHYGAAGKVGRICRDGWIYLGLPDRNTTTPLVVGCVLPLAPAPFSDALVLHDNFGDEIEIESDERDCW